MAKRTPKPITAYVDCFQVWETALREGSLKLDFPVVKKAVAFRLRLNVYRALIREQNASQNLPPISSYDHFQVALRGASLIIAMQSTLEGVIFSTQSGTAVTLAEAFPAETAPEQLLPQYRWESDDLPE